MEGRGVVGTANPQVNPDSGMDKIAAVADFYVEEYIEREKELELMEIQSKLAGLTEEGIHAVLGIVPEQYDEDVKLVATYDSDNGQVSISEKYVEDFSEDMAPLADFLEDYGPTNMARNLTSAKCSISDDIGAEIAYSLGDEINELSDEVLDDHRGTYIVPIEPEPM